jgi:hypothetical protein
MKQSVKIGIVAGGFAAALLIAVAVVAFHIALTSGPTAQASSGMYAFGDLVLFVAVFCVVSLAPTAAALFFLRSRRRFWTVLSVSGCAIAVTGLVAVGLFATGRNEVASPLATWAGYSILRILAAPLLAFVFMLCAIMTPERLPRLALLVATLMEAAVSAYAVFVWVVPLIAGR